MQTAFGQIAHLTQTTGDARSPLQREIVKLSRVIAGLALAIGAVVFVVGQWIGLALALILLIDYTEIGNAVFGTASLRWSAWLAILPCALGMLLSEEGRKRIIRNRSHTG